MDLSAHKQLDRLMSVPYDAQKGDDRVDPDGGAGPESSRQTCYEHIASIYDVDMGASMRFSDAVYFRDALMRHPAAVAADAPVLELGCGTGRITEVLVAAGLPVHGLDASAAMLLQARQRLPQTVLIHADMRHFRARQRYGAAVLPYALATYLLDAADWQALSDSLAQALLPGALIMLDSFVPKPVPTGVWLRDYARQVDKRWLVRHKRLRDEASGLRWIERRYRMAGFHGGRTLHTRECIRPYPSEQLIGLAESFLGPVQGVDYDYGAGSGPDAAQFFTVRVQATGSTCRR